MVKFSIILPVYNVEKYLSACIESILRQEYNDYEIILVDDGSTDRSSVICDEYAMKSDKIKVFHKENGGQSDARNVGLRISSGEYVFFVDSDDFLIDNRVLNRFVRIIDAKSPDVIAFKSVKWYEKTQKFGTNNDDLSVSINAVEPYQKYLELIDKDTYFNSPWSKIIRRSLLIDNGIEFELGRVGEDNDWYYKVVLHIKSLELINEPLYVYRQRLGSTTKTYTAKNLEDLLWVIEKWINVVTKGDEAGSKIVIRNSLAKQYCNAIIGYSQIDVPVQYFQRMKDLNYLLDYSDNPRVRKFRFLNRFLGFRCTVSLLKLINKLK